MLKKAYESLNKEEEIPLKIKLEEAVFSSIKHLENEDPLACMHDAIAICGGKYGNNYAQEPWPQMIYLYQPYEVEQILLPDNANTLAVQAFLRICGLKYQIEPRKNAEYMSPSGRVPFIKCGVFVLSDYENIVAFVSNKGTNLSHDLTDLEKADMRAYISLINNGLVNAEQYICWMDPSTLNDVTKKRHGSVYPWPLNHVINWERERQITKKLKVLGWANKSLDEVYTEVKMCCTALTERLDKKPYFYGKKPSAIDALIFGHVKAILKFPFPTPSINRLASVLRHFPELVSHASNISIRFFNENFDEYSPIDDFEFLNNEEEESSSSSQSEFSDNSSSTNTDVTPHNESLVFLHDHFTGPKELDALVFGHLFTILTTPLPDNRLAEIVKSFPDLVDLCKRIEKRYFVNDEK